MKELVKKYIEKNKNNILLLISIYIIGIIIGFILYILIQSNSNNNIISNLQETISMTNEGNFSGVNILKNGLQTNSIFIMVLIFSSFTIIAFSVVSLIVLLKGVSLSMYICILFKIFGPLKGFLAMFTMALIPSIIITSAFIFLGNECCILNLKLLMRINGKTIIKNLFSSLVKTLTILPFIILAIYIEQIFFRIVINM